MAQDLDTLIAVPTKNPQVDPVMAAIEDSSRAGKKLSAAADELVEVSTAVGATKAAAVVEIGKNKTIIETQKLTAELDVENKARKLAEQSGGVAQLSNLADARNKATDTLLKETAELEENVRLNSSNPIEWISNYFQQEFNRQDVQDAQRNLNAIDTAIVGAAATSDANAKTLNNLAITQNEATLAAAKENLALQATIEADAARLDAVKSNAGAYKVAMEASGLEADNQWKLWQANNTQEAIEQRGREHNLRIEALRSSLDKARLDKERSADQRAITKLNLEFMQKTNPDKISDALLKAEQARELDERNDAVIANSVKGVHNTLAKLGLPPMTDEEVLAALDAKGPTGQKFAVYAAAGFGESIGDSPAEAAIVIKDANPELLVNPEGPAMQMMADISDKMDTLGSQVKINSQQWVDKYNAAIKESMDNYDAQIATGDHSNPNHAPPVQAVAQSRDVQDDPFYQKEIEPLGLKDVDPYTIVGVGLEAIKKEPKRLEEVAAGIQKFFRAAAVSNNTTQKRVRLGLPAQTSYNVSMRRAGPLGGSSPVVDLTDITAIKKLLVHNMSSMFSIKGLAAEGLGLTTFDLLGAGVDVLNAGDTK